MKLLENKQYKNDESILRLLTQMTSKMLYKFYAFFHFFPKFYVPINAGCYDKIGFGNYNMGDNVTVHITLFIAL